MATEIDLGSVIGPQGPQGPKGATGATGPQGPKGDPFAVAKVYQSVASMNAGYASDGVAVGGFVVIETGSVDNEDNAKLYVKGDAAYEFVTDLSGAQGIQGPQGPKGSTGPTGPEGPKGATGATGPQGPKGETGAAGANGADGKTPTFSINEAGHLIATYE